MRLGRLALKVYLYSVATGLATITVFIISFQCVVRDSNREDLSVLADHLVTDLWKHRNDPARAQDTPRRPKFPMPHVTVYDVEGNLAASTVTPPAAMLPESQVRRLEQADQLELEGDTIARPIREDGRLVAIGVVNLRPPAPPGLLVPGLALPLGALALLFLAATIVSTRHVARPLQKLADAAKRFGRGELGVRSKLRRRDELGELGVAFDEMADRVTDLMAAQQELLANVSHEFLTPMSRIRVAVDLITEGADAGQAREMVLEITHDLVELERLLDDVMVVSRLDLARLNEGAAIMPLRHSTVTVEELVHRAVSRFRSQWNTHEVVVDIQAALPAISVDDVLLRRVLDNLMENARKYSEAGTTIYVRAEAAESTVSISVADSGIGIADADLQKVFTPFFRSDRSRTRASGGVGLGLALASRVVEAHRGTIGLESSPGSGTTVTLTLPLSGDR